ncbi:MAG: alpha/beta hydrolase family protein [Actinomycetales bacterium]
MAEDRSVLTRPAPAPARTLTYGVDPDQVIDVYPGRSTSGTSTDRPAIVLVHGGFWRPEYERGHLRGMAAALADAGWTTYLIEYRRQPGVPASTFADVHGAIQASSADRPGSALLLVGHSAGGHLVLHAASEGLPQVRAVVALAPVADLGAAVTRNLDDGAAIAFLGHVPSHRHCPIVRQAPSVPVLILHGDQDGIVPIDMSRDYVRTHPPARLQELPGIGHFALVDSQSEAWPMVIQAIAQTAAVG